ncbi:plasmid recombination protein [[Brevibacterium] frigoritolerans]|nr:plasmid recombination protein [Peribacillus frigoritolerans]
MSYAVCRMEKMKSHDLKGMQFHNQRERESKTNPDIDKSKSGLNYDLVNPEKIDYNKRVKEIIENQKTGTRKTRKDAVLVNELLVTSDRGFFERLDPQEQKRFFEESYKLFSERYGEQNIAYATVHNDENTPHMHLGVVPMKDGKLQGKNVFNRQELLWIQNKFPKHMQGLGFDVQRGEENSKREHLTTQQFKAKTLQEKVEDLEMTLHTKQAEKQEIETSIKDIEGRLSDLGKSLDHVKKVDEVEIKEKGGLIRSRTVELATEDFEGIKMLAKASEGLKTKSEQFEGYWIQEVQKNDVLKDEIKALKKENVCLKDENKELVRENKFLSRTIDRFKEHYKKKIKNLDLYVGYFKAEILEKMKMKPLTKYFSDEKEIEGGKGFLAIKKEEKEKEINSTRKKNRDSGLEL